MSCLLHQISNLNKAVISLLLHKYHIVPYSASDYGKNVRAQTLMQLLEIPICIKY